MTTRKKILIGLGVAFVALIVLSAVLGGSESTTDTSPSATNVTTEVAPAPVTITSLAGCRPADDIRCEVYRNLFFQISTVYFPHTSVEFTDAAFDWVDCVAFIASEHIFLDSSQSLVEGAVQDGINLCGPIS